MLVDVYQKGWALRYLREAIEEIKIARRDGRAFNLIFDALKKAEMAVYYSLGEPLFIEGIVNEVLERGVMPNNPILKYLVEMKKSISILESTLHEHVGNKSLREVDEIVSRASVLINLIISLCVED
ncbi:MAG: hypothetical protein QXR84_07010 [Candidatus Bathyarchaeia archaeon]|nr:hypothetical protein [Candidatus Bathyarchaeota archaeon]